MYTTSYPAIGVASPALWVNASSPFGVGTTELGGPTPEPEAAPSRFRSRPLARAALLLVSATFDWVACLFALRGGQYGVWVNPLLSPRPLPSIIWQLSDLSVRPSLSVAASSWAVAGRGPGGACQTQPATGMASRVGKGPATSVRVDVHAWQGARCRDRWPCAFPLPVLSERAGR